MALNKEVYRRMSNEFFFFKKTFVLDKRSLGKTPITSFFKLGISMCEGVSEDSC